MSERFDLGHIESCMGGNLKSPLFELEQYSQRMKVGVLGGGGGVLCLRSGGWTCVGEERCVLCLSGCWPLQAPVRGPETVVGLLVFFLT